MADDYNTLKQSVENFTLRKDQPFDVILQNAESQINKLLRTNLMKARECVQIGDTEEQFIEVPPGFIEAESFVVDSTGDPVAFTIIGTNIDLGKAYKDIKLTMVFYKKLDPLSDQNTKNEILTAYPRLYLYAVILEHYIWADDDPNIQKYLGLFNDEITSINDADKKSFALAQNYTTKLSRV